MGGYEVAKAVAEREGLSLYRISKEMGRNPNFLSSASGRGSSPSCATMAEVLSHCGWKLVAVPSDSIPEGGIVIN